MAPPLLPATPSPPPTLPRGVLSFSPLLKHSLNGFAVVDADGRYVWVSDSMCRLLRLDKTALLGCVHMRARTATAGTHGSGGVARPKLWA
jgi:hypothetical protein